MEQHNRSSPACCPARAAQAAAGFSPPEISPLRPGVPQPPAWRDRGRQSWLAGQPIGGRQRGRTSCCGCCSCRQITARTACWKGRAGGGRAAGRPRLRTRSQPPAADLWQLDPGGPRQARRWCRGIVSRGRGAPPPAAATQAHSSRAALLPASQQEPAAQRKPGQPIQVHYAAFYGRDGVAHRPARFPG
jgi:hypothetical protein